MPRDAKKSNFIKKDILILWDLYQYRVLNKQTIKDRYFPNSKCYVDQRIKILKYNKCIKTGTYGGGVGERKGKKGFPFYQITQKGISVLRERGYTAKQNEDMLRIQEKAIPYYVEVGRIALNVTPYGWAFKDSRAIKKEFHLNRGDQIHGSLTSPNGTEYGFYVLEAATTELNMRKTIKEISRLNNRENRTKTLRNFIIFAKGQDSIDHFIEKANEEQYDYKGMKIKDRLRPSGALCVIPLDYGIAYLQSALSDKSYFESIFKRKKSPVQWLAPSDKTGFEFIAKHQGRKVYVVNMLDGDLSKVDEIEDYFDDAQRSRRFGEERYDVLVISSEKLAEYHGRLIGRRVEYFKFTDEQIEKSKREAKSECN